MSQFALELHPDKTRLIEFGRFAMADRRARGERRPETFDFLGFTHYCKKKRNGNFGLGRKPIAKRVTRTLKRGLDLAGGGEKSAKLGVGQASVCR